MTLKYDVTQKQRYDHMLAELKFSKTTAGPWPTA